MAILITGSVGYLGAHTCLQMLAAGHDIVGLDNLSNSSEESHHRVRKISEMQFSFINADIRNKRTLRAVFQQHSFLQLFILLD